MDEEKKINPQSELSQEIPNSPPLEKQHSSEDLDMKIEEEGKITSLKNAITKFLSEHTIYEAIPEDMKILVFNDKLLIKDSIEAMIKEDIYCGLLYNSEQNKHSGIFTIRDVLGLLLIGYKKLVGFLNNEKNINSYEMLKDNLEKFFSEFDSGENDKNIIDNIIITKDEEINDINGNRKNNNVNNDEQGMEIEENDNNNNNNNNQNINKKEFKTKF